jgi:hypothetical protein
MTGVMLFGVVEWKVITRSINGTSRRRSFNLKGTGLINGWGFNLPTAKIVNAFRQQVM